jgi:predicted transcriptional regulator
MEVATSVDMKKELARILIQKTNLSKRKIAEILELDRNIVQRLKVDE